MTDKPRTPEREKKIKEIEAKDRTLSLFNIANLALMANTGTIKIISAIEILSSSESPDPLTLTQISTETSTHLVTSIFVYLAIIANKVGKFKKHNELTLKAHELKHEEKIASDREKVIRESSKIVTYADTALTILTGLLAFIFLVLGFYSIYLKAHANITRASIIDIIGSISYILAVSFTLINKIIGDRLQARIEKNYIKPVSD